MSPKIVELLLINLLYWFCGVVVNTFTVQVRGGTQVIVDPSNNKTCHLDPALTVLEKFRNWTGVHSHLSLMLWTELRQTHVCVQVLSWIGQTCVVFSPLKDNESRLDTPTVQQSV